MKKRKLFLTVLSFFIMVSVAGAWSFTRSYSFTPIPTTGVVNTFSASDYYFGTTPKSITSSVPGSYASASAYGCDNCAELKTNTYSASGPGWFSSSASAEASSGIVCTEPPICGDVDDDGICDESDNCEFIPNTNQSDLDDDQIGDVCDDTPGDPPADDCLSTDLDCLLEKACPCEIDWRNHGAYVKCTVKFEQDHRGEPGIGDVVSIAGCSDCGGSHQGQGCE